MLEIVQYREVLFNILSQDLKVKYRRTLFGYFWSLLNPVLQLAVIATVFSYVVRQGIRDYTQYLFSGLLVWNFFQSTLQMSSTSILENENFIKKIYLPKMIFPLSKLCLRAIDFVFALFALSVIGIFVGFHYYPSMAALPLAMVILFAFTFGLSLMVAVGTVYFRDIQYLMGVFLQLLYFATPIMYPENLLPEKFRFVLNFNPFLAQLRLFQKIIYVGEFPTASEWGLAVALAVISVGLGISVLKNLEEDLVFRL